MITITFLLRFQAIHMSELIKQFYVIAEWKWKTVSY